MPSNVVDVTSRQSFFVGKAIFCQHAPNYALKRTVREDVSGAIMRCGPHGRLA